MGPLRQLLQQFGSGRARHQSGQFFAKLYECQVFSNSSLARRHLVEQPKYLSEAATLLPVVQVSLRCTIQPSRANRRQRPQSRGQILARRCRPVRPILPPRFVQPCLTFARRVPFRLWSSHRRPLQASSIVATGVAKGYVRMLGLGKVRKVWTAITPCSARTRTIGKVSAPNF